MDKFQSTLKTKTQLRNELLHLHNIIITSIGIT